MRFSRVIFDLDGTLCDTIGDLCASRNATLEHFGHPVLGRAESLRDISLVDVEFMRMGLPEELRGDAEYCSRVIEFYRAHQNAHFLDHTRPFPGISDVVGAVKASGARTAVLTNKSHDRAAAVVEKFFPGVFEAVRGAIPGTFFKPDVRLTEILLGSIGGKCGDREHTVLVGDSDVDVSTARNAGIYCVAVTWGYRDKELLLSDGADELAATPAELEGILLGD